MRRISDDLTNSALIEDMKKLKEGQDKLAAWATQTNKHVQSMLKSVKETVECCAELSADVKVLKGKGPTVSLADKMRIANIIYSAYGYEGAVLANQLDLIYWRETGDSFLDDKSNMFDDELVTVSELADIYKMSAADVNRILQANGYITRKEKTGKGKTGYISLTPLGRASGGRMKRAPHKHFNIHWPKGILMNLRLTRI